MPADDSHPVQNLHPNDIIHQLPSAVLLYEMTTVREILLSGMQLELYNLWEKVFVYWYLAKVLGKHLECLNSLLSVIPEGMISQFLLIEVWTNNYTSRFRST